MAWAPPALWVVPFIGLPPHPRPTPPLLGVAQVVATQMQAQAKLKAQALEEGRPAEHIRSDVMGVCRQLYEEGGVAGFWKGARGGGGGKAGGVA